MSRNTLSHNTVSPDALAHRGEDADRIRTIRQQGAGPGRTPYYYLGRAAEVWWTAINKQADFVHRETEPRKRAGN